MVAGTIAQNIALGLDEAEIDDRKLKSAVEKAHLKEFVLSLPAGLNTSIGKHKDEFSGGQLQRIGLARALYTEPGLLVMDEATSALDADSENQINIALEAMRGNVTVILIAHRLNTIQRSDTVYLMEEGRIVDSGRFEKLLQSNPKVQSLVELMKFSSEN
jgi:ABC-type multidrug transport system fused ATPase/permease subunit